MEVTLTLVSFESIGTTKIKFRQILVCFWLNSGDWVIVPGLFIVLLKMTIYRDVAIFIGWHSPFLIVPYLTFQKGETLES